jgi:hypothetical protein
MKDLIDPEDFPFTEDEVYRAERLLSPEADARQMAADIASAGREAQAARIAAAAARARGSRNPAEINPPVMGAVRDVLRTVGSTLAGTRGARRAIPTGGTLSGTAVATS